MYLCRCVGLCVCLRRVCMSACLVVFIEVCVYLCRVCRSVRMFMSVYRTVCMFVACV